MVVHRLVLVSSGRYVIMGRTKRSEESAVAVWLLSPRVGAYLVMPVAFSTPLATGWRVPLPLGSETLLICDSCEWIGFRGRGRSMRSLVPSEMSAEEVVVMIPIRF